MPTIADYIVILDGSFTLPDPTTGSSDRHFPITPPAANTRSPAIVAFRVNPNDNPTLQVRLNNATVVRQTFDTEPQRSWHAVVPANTFLATGNEVVVSLAAGSPGSVQVADLVLFFQADVS
jgi:hypothetical protein